MSLLQTGTILLQSGAGTTKWDDFITKWDSFWLLQSGTILLQSGTAFVITKWDDFITKWDGYYKVGRFYYKVGQVLQSGTIITKWALTALILRLKRFWQNFSTPWTQTMVSVALLFLPKTLFTSICALTSNSTVNTNYFQISVSSFLNKR